MITSNMTIKANYYLNCLLDDSLCVEHDALGGVNEDANAVGQPHGRRHLVGEVDMARGVEDVHDERLLPDVLADEGDGHGLNGDAPLLLGEERVRVPHRLVVLKEIRSMRLDRQGQRMLYRIQGTLVWSWGWVCCIRQSTKLVLP